MIESIEKLKSRIRNRGAHRRGRLVRDYFLISVILIGGGLITSGLLEIYFQYRESYENLNLLQQEVATGAAFKAEQFIEQIENAMRTATKSPEIARKGLSEDFQPELTRLLLVTPAIEEAMAVDLTGVVHLQVSRFRAVLPTDNDEMPPQAAIEAAKKGDSFFSPVYFARGSEPYNSIAVPIERFAGELAGILWAKVNLKYIWEVIQDIKVGKAGYAYIVTRSGDLVAHPDLSLVLQRRNLSDLYQTRAAFQTNSLPEKKQSLTGRNSQGNKVLISHVLIPSLDWAVIIERPLDEAYEPLYASIFRTSSLLLVGLWMALLASVFVARRVVRPLQTLRLGAERIGKGDLDFRLRLKTGDEIETLAEEFNKMTGALQEAYTGLEKKVAERTRELSEALDYQTAIGEVLRVMVSSPTDLNAILDRIREKALRLCNAPSGAIFIFDGEAFHVSSITGSISSEFKTYLDSIPISPGAETPLRLVGLEKRCIHSDDILSDPRFSLPGVHQKEGFRTTVAVPIIKENKLIGAFTTSRREVRPFTEREINLLETFADQAAIVIENVHLFQELQTRTSELARSVKEFKALGEVSQAVSSTLDLQAVLATIVFNAVSLSGSDLGAMFEYREQSQEFLLQATYQLSDELLRALEKVRIPVGSTILGQTVANREPVQVADISAMPDYPLREVVQRIGIRSILGVPLMRQGIVMGALIVGRRAPGQFTNETVEVLQTFAAQSVVAIQNARLFREIELANERLKELDRMKSYFVSNVSHELRTPLTAIEGLIDNMLDGITGKLNGKQVRYVTGIKESADRLARLIDDLLDLSVIEAGRVELKAESFSVTRLMHQIIDTLRPMAEDKRIELEMKPGDESLTAWADRDKFTQILTNLISNAVKFSHSESKVDIAVQKNGGAWLEISVTDGGLGIAPEEADKIFDEFYQIRRAGEQKSRGVGLGLAISKKLVEMHGGKIWVESDLENGSTFFFTVPAKRPLEVAASTI